MQTNSGGRIFIVPFIVALLIVSCSDSTANSTPIVRSTEDLIRTTPVVATPTLTIRATIASTEINTFSPEVATPTPHLAIAGQAVFQRIVDDRRRIFLTALDGGQEYSFQDKHAINATWPVLSPDGKHIAFVSTRDSTEENEIGSRDIYILEINNESSQKITNELAINDMPAWSPDGSKLAFIGAKETSDTSDLYVMNSDGSQTTQMTFDAMVEFKPIWSPDGKKLVVLESDGTTQRLKVIDVNRTSNTLVIKAADVGNYYAWSPDSQLLALSIRTERQTKLGIADIHTGDVIRVFDNDLEESGEPTWSPDARFVAFSAKEDTKFNIYITDATSNSILQMINMPTDSLSPVWSADGRFIFFVSRVRADSVIDTRNIWDLFAVAANDWQRPILLAKNLSVPQFSVWISQ